ncbi:retrovirus-related Pol polyprotein from transposon 297 [Trichonephila clavipes]|nr:retrovirus-related Pol polyprotein from transposon 297 [Trichonephila clavipes]
MEEEAEKYYIIKGLKENRAIEIQLQSCSNIEELKEKMKLLDVQEKSKSNLNEIIYPKYPVTRIPHHTNQFARRQQYGEWNWRIDQTQHPDAITGSRYNVHSPQFLSPSYHHPSFSLQRPTVSPRSWRLQQRPTVFRPDTPTFYPRQRTRENYTLVQPHRTGDLIIIQGIINFKQVEVLLDTGSSVNIIPKKNIISQIKGHHNVEYIKTKIATINGEVKKFDQRVPSPLKDLVLTDQLKKIVAKEVKEHFVDIWRDIKSSSELIHKLDDYEFARGKTSNHKVLPEVRTSFHSKINKEIRTVVKAKEESRKSFRGHSQFESRNPLSCYGCGKPGYIKSKCPDCNPSKGDPAHFGILRINSLSPSNRNAVLKISINGVSGTAFADSGASHLIAGETLYTILLQQGAAFEKTVISLSFADGIVTQKEVLCTFQTVILDGRKFKTPFIILPDAKSNSTLLGVDFLENAGIVLNFRKNCWTFWDDFRKSYSFAMAYQSTSINVRPVAINNCQLREDEGQELLGSQRAELDSLLRNNHSIFEARGEATPFIEHSINTENHPPISVPPYRMNPDRKELLNKELDSLLQKGIIVECESPYASPVVLIPKPNGSMRLCIDYRKLNAQTVPNSYPLPRMDDLLNEAKPTPYMSTIDLRSGYHQVKVAAEDPDKTAFTCPFGIYKFTRMPFGL